jgi:hypothetical protein
MHPNIETVPNGTAATAPETVTAATAPETVTATTADTDETVPNGTATSRLDELINRYNSFAKKSAENIIKMAETLVDAERLSELERHAFCAAVSLSRPTYQKLLKIGQEASRFEPFLEQLPNSWTTLYKLAALEIKQFDRVAHDPQFAPTMTAEELKVILGDINSSASKSKGKSAGKSKCKSAGKGKSGCDHGTGAGGDGGHAERLWADCIIIHLKGLEPSKRKEVCNKALSLAEEYGCEYAEQGGTYTDGSMAAHATFEEETDEEFEAKLRRFAAEEGLA